MSLAVRRRSLVKTKDPLRFSIVRWPTTDGQRPPAESTSLRSCLPSSSSARRRNEHLYSCTDRADASCASQQRPVRLSDDRFRLRSAWFVSDRPWLQRQLAADTRSNARIQG